ncbi:Protein of unknown function DUF131 [Ignisphaera aggregans DSM 17230]|uniref:DUF131 domain-containing protein n=1 Tax=Ignisphaera aggregans (strain DSM 17230 / JCM 13409 / AQ1.S1) TaxID=583356 RepID=E0SRJ5_IGNAA|nr:Protein of unknown function DUF131 [Ignisphaera aggregans DSM 17230]
MSITFIALIMFIISFILIFIGMLIIMISSLISRKPRAKEYGESERDIESGAVIIIGPFPFAIGSRRIIKPLLILSIIFFIIIVILFFVLLYIPKLVIP